MARDIVVVIDPGHGGENEGALWESYVEKEITLKVAKAMKDELDKYEGITAYLTRDDDIDLSLKERADVAENYNADFLFCLHFNMSEQHTLYGSECWISAYDRYYSEAYDFSRIEMEALTGLGLFDRGIKTRISSKADRDYYGIIRCAKDADVPSVIIEHCHLDHENDAPFVNQDTWLEAYGRLDATAVAKYYGLKSEILGVDYSGYNHEVTPVPETPMYPDATPPEYCRVNLFEIDEFTGQTKVKLEAFDAESRIMYYTYSLDGGESYATYLPWPKDEATVSFNIQIPENKDCSIIFSADNLYNLTSYSDEINIEAFSYTVIEDESAEEASVGDNIDDFIIKEVAVDVEKNYTNGTLELSWVNALEVVGLAALITVLTVMITLRRRLKKRK